MIGATSKRVEIVEYCKDWKDEFEKEKAVLTDKLKDFKVDIQHVGSTSIPGCTAKPLIDINIGVPTLKYGEKLIQPLESLGYIYRGDAGVKGRHFFKKCVDGKDTHFIHVTKKGGEQWNHQLLFRDYLIKHPEYIKEYSNLKHELAMKFKDSPTRLEYTTGKTEFITKIIELAKQEKSKTK